MTNYGWYSYKQKVIHGLVTREKTPSPCYWVNTDNNLVEVTMVNGDPYDSDTIFSDMVCVGEVVRFYCIGSPHPGGSSNP